MTRSLIIYFSQGGTTAKIAKSIALGMGDSKNRVDLYNIKDEQPPGLYGYDILGVGLPVYIFRSPFLIMDYLKCLPDLNGLPVFVFVMYGTYRGDTCNVVRDALTRKGGQEIGVFYARGADYFLGYLKQGYFFSPNHPTEQEIEAAKVFGKNITMHLRGKEYIKPKEDRSPSWIYRLERFLTCKWLVKHIYSRLFRVKSKVCTACSLCMKLCPTGNINKDGEGKPVWGRDCLLCLYCEMKCPTDAIISPMSWPTFYPILYYNIRAATKDSSLNYVQVSHSGGSTHIIE